MSMFFFSALSNGQTIAFDPTADTLFFDATGVSAAGVTVSRPDPDGTTTRVVVGSKSIILNGLIPEEIDSWNFVFANGSRLLVGNDFSGTTGPSGSLYIEPDSSANFLFGGEFHDQLLGLGGDDTLNGGLGNDVLDGGEGTDTAAYDDATAGVRVNLGTSGQQNTLGAGWDTLKGIENLTGSAFNDTLTGNAGANVLEGLGGNDVLDGGAGIDTADYQGAASAVTVSLAVTGAQNTHGAGSDTLRNIENLTGSIHNDTLTGNSGNNVLEGFLGDDTIVGGAGNDTLAGGSGNDNLSGGTGNDTYHVDAIGDRITEAAGAGTDTVVAWVSWTLGANLENLTLEGAQTLGNSLYWAPLNGTGNSLANVIAGNGGDNVLNGGAGVDTVSYTPATNSVKVNLGFTSRQTTGWGRDTLRNFENVTGSAFADHLIGNSGANVLVGGAGDDVLVGGAGNDTLQGDAGSDTASYFNAGAAVTASLLVTAAQNTGGAGTDRLTGIENLQGSAFNDTLTGDTRNNVIEGLGGNDRLTGGSGVDTASYESASSRVSVNLATTAAQNTSGAGSDTLSGFENLRGSAFNDTLTGNTLANVIDGGAGGDAMAGGTGNDTYRVDSSLTKRLTVVNGAKTLVDWSGGADTVTEAAGAGTDTVETWVDFALPANVENLTAMEFGLDTGYYNPPSLTLSGNGLDNLIVDNSSSNRVDGGDGVDTFSVRNASGGVSVNLPSTGVGTAYHGSAYGPSSDTLTSIENLIGSAYNDSFTVNGYGNRYDGGAGEDTLSYALLPIPVGGISQPPVVVNLAVTGPQDTVGAGVDSIRDFENLTGGNGDDRLTGDGSDNILVGANGSDTLEGGAGNDRLVGSYDNTYGGPTDAGVDTASYAGAASGVSVSLALVLQDTLGAGIDALFGIENLTGSAFNDTLTGSDGVNVLSGGGGNDVLNGGAGDDTLLGELGDDTLNGGDGNDSLIGGPGHDTLNGGAGLDTADYSGAASSVAVNLGTGAVSGGAGNDTLGSIENLIGSGFNDTLTGSSGANVIAGGAGNDVIDGGGGHDVLSGGAGNDTLNGGTGIDTASYGDATAAVTVNLGIGGAQNTGGAGSDTLTGIENLLGSTFNDTLTGSSGDNLIDGGGGNDTLAGGAGNDTLSYASFSRPQYDSQTLYVNLPDGKSAYTYYYYPGTTAKDTLSGFENIIGSTGTDNLTGNADANRLTGSGGSDTLTGGGGADRFRFITAAEGGDSITDFVSGTDKIEVVSSNFGGLASGALNASRFKTAGTPLTTGDAVFLFNGTTGALAFDADGNGTTAAMTVATLTNAGTKTLVAGDIQVVAA